MTRTMKVYFFGDSIFFGQYVSPHHGWVTKVSAGLESYFREKHNTQVMVQNPSISGNTTRDALQRMAYDVQAHKPDFVIMQYGMNDCNYWQTDLGVPRVKLEGFEQNLIEMVDRVHALGAKAMLQTNHPSSRTTTRFPLTNITYEDSNRIYNEATRRAAAKAGVPLNDMEKAAEVYCRKHNIPARDLVLDDLLHLSLEGHKLYAEACLPFIRDFIESHWVKNEDRHARTA